MAAAPAAPGLVAGPDARAQETDGGLEHAAMDRQLPFCSAETNCLLICLQDVPNLLLASFWLKDMDHRAFHCKSVCPGVKAPEYTMISRFCNLSWIARL